MTGSGAATPGRLAGDEGLEHRLGAAGLRPEAARAVAGLFRSCGRALLDAGAGADEPALAFFVPGRIEVLGKHTDYCGGRSLIAAIDRGFAFAAVPGPGDGIEIVDARLGEARTVRLSPVAETPPRDWAGYPATAARRLARNFPSARRGARVAFASDLPAASGMSSSSALIVGTSLVIAGMNGLARSPELRAEISDPESLAAYLASVENGSAYGSLAGDSGVGTRGGSEDHTAMLCSRPGLLSLYTFGPPILRGRYPLPPGLVLAIASSGVVAEKRGAAMERYNRASFLARAAVEAWNRATGSDDPHLAAILARGPQAAEGLRRALRVSPGDVPTAEILARVDGFEEESERIIPDAVRSLERGDARGFAAAARRSREVGARSLGNAVAETTFLAEEADRLGARGASPFGAGFGGSVWALVAIGESTSFLERWRASYAARFPARGRDAIFFLSEPSPAAFELAAAGSESLPGLVAAAAPITSREG